ncbi:MAG: amino acid ABC transporter permease, partial [Proteobacteria bacterium]
MRASFFFFLMLFTVSLVPADFASAASEIRVGSKAFTEGFLLGELGAQTIERANTGQVIRRFGLGNTGILYEALRKGEIDVYTEYTGTISEALLKDPKIKDPEEIKKRVEPMGLVMSNSLGFNNTYALAVTKAFAEKNGLKTISDLKKVEGKIRPVFSHEFVSRADGLTSLSKSYGLDFGQNRQSLEHSLAYEAVANGSADIIDVYSTDPKIKRLDLVILEDNLRHFPRYEAVW